MFTSGPGQTYTVSVFVNPIIEDLGWSRTSVSGLYTAGSLTAAVAMFLVGRLLDQYGARVVLPAVVILFGFALILIGQVSQQWHLYAGFALIRILGQGSLTLIPTTLIAVWFVRLRGRVMALNSLGAVASQAAFPPLIHLLISAYGWRSAWVALGLTVWLLMLIPAILLVRRSPESIGLLPDGDGVPSEGQISSAVTDEVNLTLSEALKTRAFWLLIFAGSSQSLIGTALVFHHVSVMDSLGLSTVVAASALSVIAPGALSGTFIAGFLCDRFPNRFVLVGGQLVLVFAMLLTFVMAQPLARHTLRALTGSSRRYSNDHRRGHLAQLLWAYPPGFHSRSGHRGHGGIRRSGPTALWLSVRYLEQLHRGRSNIPRPPRSVRGCGVCGNSAP